MICNARSEDDIRNIVARMADIDIDDVEITLIATYDDLVKYLRGARRLLKSIFSLVFPSAGPLTIDVPEIEEEWDGHFLTTNKEALRANTEAFDKAFLSYFEDNRSRLEPEFKPMMRVYAWCDEDEDLKAIMDQLGGIPG